MPRIHPTAEVSKDASIADDVEIGPYCVIRGRVRLAAGVRLIGNVYLNGPVTIGEATILYPFACVGFEPQDVKFKPGMTTPGVVIGRDGILREGVTVHAASKPDGDPTTIGDRVFMMCHTHVAHDCIIGDRVTMVNGSGVAGHAVVADDVTMGGNAVVHQFVRIGRMVMMSGDCAVSLDLPPFCTLSERNRIGGLNIVGLRRSGMPRDQITALRGAFRDVLRRNMPRAEAVAILRERAVDCPPIAELADFVAASKRGITPGFGKPPRGAIAAARELASAADLDDAPARAGT